MLLYDISAFMFYFIFYFFYKLDRFSMKIFYNDATASRDVTYLFTDPGKICTAFVKLNSKHILFMRIFFIFDLFFEIITIIM